MYKFGKYQCVDAIVDASLIMGLNENTQVVREDREEERLEREKDPAEEPKRPVR